MRVNLGTQKPKCNSGPVKNQFASLPVVASRFTRAHHASIIDQYVYTARFSKDLVDGALPTLFVGDIQEDLSETQYVLTRASS